jgi:hypothetical protein
MLANGALLHEKGLKQTQSLAGAMSSAVLVLLASGISLALDARAADPCLKAPNAEAPKGMHWYYHIDRTKNRKCWYLSREGMRVDTRASRRALGQSAPRDDEAKALLSAPDPSPSVVGEKATAPSSQETAAPAAAAQAPSPAPVRWPDPPTPVTTTNTVFADNHTGSDSGDDMPAVWPVLSASERAAYATSGQGALLARLPAPNVSSGTMIALATIASAMILVAGGIFWTFGIGRRRQSPRRNRDSASDRSKSRSVFPHVPAISTAATLVPDWKHANHAFPEPLARRASGPSRAHDRQDRDSDRRFRNLLHALQQRPSSLPRRPEQILGDQPTDRYSARMEWPGYGFGSRHQT